MPSTDHKCQHGATCKDEINTYTCVCPAGYNGVHCETDIDDCLSTPCVNGICKDAVANYSCNCSRGYEGVPLICDS